MHNNILLQVKELEKAIIRNLAINTDGVSEDLHEFVYKPTPTQMQIIGYIVENGDREVYQRNLEAELNLRRATISDVLQRMEKNGLIKREIDENDTRTKKIVLVGKAKQLYEENSIKLQILEKKAVQNISDEEMQIFLNVIKKLIKNINNES